MSDMTIGKTKIELRARGCIGCGTEHSFNWEVARVIDVTINGRALTLGLHRCGDCMQRIKDGKRNAVPLVRC